MATKINVIIERDDNGYYAYCPDLPGCHTQGDTFEKALANAREAAQLYLETLDADERIACLSKEVITVAVEV